MDTSMKKIKIIQFILSFGVGGAENIVKQYCELIDSNKFDLLVIAISNAHSYHDEELRQNGIKVIYVNDIINAKFKFLPSAIKKLMRFIFRPSLLRNLVNSFNPDIIHYHLPCSQLLLQAKASKETKFYLTVHSDPEYFWGVHSQWKKDYKSTIKLAQRHRFTFIALHNDMKESLDNVWFNKVDHRTIIMNNGIDISKFVDLPTKKGIRNELNLPIDSLIIGHVGSMIPVKNHSFLLDVFYEVKKINNDAILLLIGDGINKISITEKIKKLGIEDSVKLLGIRSDIPRIMKALDVLVFPSLTEGISLTLVEAQVSGLRCVISDTIPKYNEISTNLVKFLKLSDPPSVWANRIIEIDYNEDYSCDAEKWDIKEIVLDLEKEYQRSITD